MGKGFYISKPVAAVAIILGVGAVATIIALSVVYDQEKQKNSNNVSGGVPTEAPTEAPTTQPGTGPTTAPVTTAPPDQPWNKYRLPKSLSPISYSVELWPRLKKNNETGLYIFTGKEEPSACLLACLDVCLSISLSSFSLTAVRCCLQ